MVNIFTKIFATKKVLIKPDAEFNPDVVTIGKQVEKKVKKIFKGSLAIRVVTAGSTNACEQELNALGNAFYDVDRFGVHFVASPRHADMIMVTGPVSRNMKEALLRTYNAAPEPKIVVAVGDDAIDGGVFKGSYAVCDGAKEVVPVHYSIAGDPPTPLQMMNALLGILNDLDSKDSKTK